MAPCCQLLAVSNTFGRYLLIPPNPVGAAYGSQQGGGTLGGQERDDSCLQMLGVGEAVSGKWEQTDFLWDPRLYNEDQK